MLVFEKKEKLHGATPLSECELHDPPGEPGAVVPHARFGERREETRLGKPDCGCARRTGKTQRVQVP